MLDAGLDDREPWCKVPGCWESNAGDGLCLWHEKNQDDWPDAGNTELRVVVTVAACFGLLTVACFLPTAAARLACAAAVVLSLGWLIGEIGERRGDLARPFCTVCGDRADRLICDSCQGDAMAEAREWEAHR